jgi:hypothetical protein
MLDFKEFQRAFYRASMNASFFHKLIPSGQKLPWLKLQHLAVPENLLFLVVRFQKQMQPEVDPCGLAIEGTLHQLPVDKNESFHREPPGPNFLPQDAQKRARIGVKIRNRASVTIVQVSF